MDEVQALFQGFAVALSPINIALMFLGIVLGLAFHFVGQLFTRLGAINEWQPMLSVMAMPLTFLLLAVGMLWFTERR